MLSGQFYLSMQQSAQCKMILFDWKSCDCC